LKAANKLVKRRVSKETLPNSFATLNTSMTLKIREKSLPTIIMSKRPQAVFQQRCDFGELEVGGRGDLRE
jgi:hypothetical protein